MLVPEWMDENVASLWWAVFRLQAELRAITEYMKETYPERFSRKDDKRYLMTVKTVPVTVYVLQNKYTVYYRQKRSYYNIRPPKTIPRLENDVNLA